MKNLIIQAQRMGDLVMTYPLFTWLKKQDDKELFVLAEKSFYDELIRISPQVTYIPVSEMDFLKQFRYDTVINLSHRQDTAQLAGELECSRFFGLSEKNGIKKIEGAWQLYRASLTHNNHYNRMHWADLNALDCIDLPTLKQIKWQKPTGPNNGKIGLFVGASEEAKRPSTEFWAEFAVQLCRKGYDPVFISGPDEKERQIAYDAAKAAKMPHGVIAGSLSIFELINFLKNLQLFVCPDTGPMHIASFAGVPTLNLSIGPVHPFETAPYPPFHYVLRSAISCSGCWKCTKKEQFCRKAFIPHRIANLVHSLLQNKKTPQLPGMSFFETSRDEYGLYDLKPLFGEKNFHGLQANFWKFFFLHMLNGKNPVFGEAYQKNREELFSSLPKLKGLLQKNSLQYIKKLIVTEKTNKIFQPEDWQNFVPFFRPLSSYTQLMLENSNYSKNTYLEVMEFIEEFNKSLL